MKFYKITAYTAYAGEETTTYFATDDERALAVEINDRIFDNASEYESHHLDDNSTMEEIADYWDQTGAYVEEVEENEVDD